MKKILLVLLLSAFIPSLAIAEKSNISETYPSLGRGVRPLGMGNAFLTMKGSDENVLFYNPAAIRDFSSGLKFTTALPLPPLEINYSVIQLTKDLFDFQDNLDAAATDDAKIDVFNNFVDTHIGNFYSLETHVPLIGFYNRYLAFSLITDSKLGVSFRNRAFPNFEVKSRNLGGIAVGSAYGLFEDTLTFGVATKIIYGIENEQIMTTSDILTKLMDDFKWNNWKRGLGIGFDLGVKYEIYDFGQSWIEAIKPTIAVSYQNIGNTKFYFMKKNGGPDKIPQSVSAGIGFHPEFGSIKTSLMFDIRDINVKEDFWLKTNAGAEARFPAVIGLVKPSIRGGLNQGYPTAGVGLDIWKFVCNLAFFGKEVGSTTRQKAGYRIAAELISRF